MFLAAVICVLCGSKLRFLRQKLVIFCIAVNANGNSIPQMFIYPRIPRPLPAIDSITHNFLESGHSHMECDAMDSSIESATLEVF